MAVSLRRRQPSGTPAGGRFAPRTSTESGIDLHPEVEMDVFEIERGIASMEEIRGDLNHAIGLLAARALRRIVLRDHPTAVRLQVVYCDAPIHRGTPGEITDHVGTVLWAARNADELWHEMTPFVVRTALAKDKFEQFSDHESGWNIEFAEL